MGVLSAGVAGFALSMGLILAIGPQNIFVLRQGLLRSHVFAVCLVCSMADALLIAVGVLGLGAYLSGVEGAEFWISMAAALFIAGYGVMRVKSSMDPLDEHRGGGWGAGVRSVRQWLSRSSTRTSTSTPSCSLGARPAGTPLRRGLPAVGAMLASFLFFFALGYGAGASPRCSRAQRHGG